MPGWAEAIILEFPESVKRICKRKRELFFYLPESSRDADIYFTPFIEGLLWRSADAITSQTDKLVGHYAWNKSKRISFDTFDILVALAIKKDHPYSARRLFINVARKKMTDRDLTWSEYVRNGGETETIKKLIGWIENTHPSHFTGDLAKDLIVLLSLILTTTDRSWCDRTTDV
jgi:hypothetical protein